MAKRPPVHGYVCAAFDIQLEYFLELGYLFGGFGADWVFDDEGL